MGIDVNLIIDNSAVDNETIEGKSVVQPGEYVLKNIDCIIIAVNGKNSEIIEQIDTIILEKPTVLSWFDIFCDMEDYISEYGPKIEGITVPYRITVPGGINGHEINYPYDENPRTYKQMKWR